MPHSEAGCACSTSCRPPRPVSPDPGCRGLASAVRRRPTGDQSRLDVGSFAHELAALLDAGLGIVESLSTLEAKEKAPSAARPAAASGQTLTEGLPSVARPAAEEGRISGVADRGRRGRRAHRRPAHRVATLRRQPGGTAHLARSFHRSRDLSGDPARRRGRRRDVPPRRRHSQVRAADRARAARRAAGLAAAAVAGVRRLQGTRWLVGAAVIVAGACRRGARNPWPAYSGWRLLGMQRLWVVGPLIRRSVRRSSFEPRRCWWAVESRPCGH